MSTRLEKTVLQSYSPGQPGQPGDPGQPYLPARSVWETRQVCSYVSYTPQEIIDYYTAHGARRELVDGRWTWVLPGGGGIAVPTDRWVCRDEPVLNHYSAQPYIPPRPPVPATPSQTIQEFQLGWNARARSIKVLSGPGRADFTIPADVVGAIVGFASEPLQSGFGDMLWAFKVGNGTLSIVERGIEVENLGAAVGNQVLSIERTQGQIVYRVSDSEVRTVPNGNLPLFLSAALYSGGDSVLNASLVDFEAEGSGAIVLAAPDALGADDVGYAQGVAVLAPPEASGYDIPSATGAISLAPPEAIGSDAAGYAQGSVYLLPLEATGEGYEDAPPPFAIGSVFMLPPTAIGSGTTGTVGSAALDMLPPVAIGADASGYAQGTAVLAAPSAYGENFLAPDRAVIASTMVMDGEASAQGLLFAVINSSFGIEGLLEVQVVRRGEIAAEIGIGDTLVTQQILQAIIASVMEARASALDPNAADDLSVWALNLDMADTGGTTRYTHFDFNSFARVGTSYYGAKADGIYLLAGRDDADEDVHAEVNFGNLNFGMLERKALPHVYAGVASDGRLLLKVVAEGQTYVYPVRGSSSELKTQRFDLGKGLRANYYELILQNDGGSLFDLSEIEFTPLKLSRRL